MKATQVGSERNPAMVRVVEVLSSWGKDCRETVYARNWIATIPATEFYGSDEWQGLTIPYHRTVYEAYPV
jgi:hypothetical protein